MVVENIDRRIRELAIELKIPKTNYALLSEHTWQAVFKANGAESWCERDIPSERIQIAPGGQIVAIARNKKLEYFTLVQVRDNGETNEADKQIGFPGGACRIWGRGKKEESNGEITYDYYALEPQVLAALRKWNEEVGMQFTGQLYIMACTCTTNYYHAYPPVLAPSIYYGANIKYEEMKEYAKTKHSVGGKIKIIKIRDLKRYHWFPNAAEVFEKLIKTFAPEL